MRARETRNPMKSFAPLLAEPIRRRDALPGALLELEHNAATSGSETMPTIYEIAKLAGVSPATVSRALNGTGYVRAEVRERIRAIADSMDYHPNSLARGLLNKRTYTLGLVVPDITNPFFPAVARGVEDVAHTNGYGVILCNTDGNLQKEAKYLKMLRTKRVDGVVFTTSRVQASHVQDLLNAGVPVVLADRRLDVMCDSVSADNVDGAYQAVAHLLSLGHTRVAMITGPANLTTAQERLEGYKQALCEHGIAFSPRLVLEGDFRQESGYRLARDLLKIDPRPTAVFAANDLMAVGVLMSLEEQGIRVPEDMALVGYDDVVLSRVTRPRLTTVAQPKYEMGAIACELLISRISHPEKEPEKVLLKPRLVVRESSVVRRVEQVSRMAMANEIGRAGATRGNNGNGQDT